MVSLFYMASYLHSIWRTWISWNWPLGCTAYRGTFTHTRIHRNYGHTKMIVLCKPREVLLLLNIERMFSIKRISKRFYTLSLPYCTFILGFLFCRVQNPALISDTFTTGDIWCIKYPVWDSCTCTSAGQPAGEVIVLLVLQDNLTWRFMFCF